jgi:hypothetical protein
MKTKKIIQLVIVISTLTSVIITGCKKEEPATTPSSESQDNAAMIEKPAAAQVKEIYYCTMHLDQTSDKPGNCPVCGMNMVKK